MKACSCACYVWADLQPSGGLLAALFPHSDMFCIVRCEGGSADRATRCLPECRTHPGNVVMQGHGTQNS